MMTQRELEIRLAAEERAELDEKRLHESLDEEMTAYRLDLIHDLEFEAMRFKRMAPLVEERRAEHLETAQIMELAAERLRKAERDRMLHSIRICLSYGGAENA